MLADQHPIRRIEEALLAPERCAAVLDDLSPIAGCPQAVMFKVHQGNIGRFLANSAAHRILKKYFGEGCKERDVITEKMVEQCSRRFVTTWVCFRLRGSSAPNMPQGATPLRIARLENIMTRTGTNRQVDLVRRLSKNSIFEAQHRLEARWNSIAVLPFSASDHTPALSGL
jgi:hypothetical protein